MTARCCLRRCAGAGEPRTSCRTVPEIGAVRHVEGAGPVAERPAHAQRPARAERGDARDGRKDDGVDRREHATHRTTQARALATRHGHLVARRGLTREDAYVLSSVAVDLRISELVDAPNWVVSAFLPLDIFEASAGAT